ncbi:hypothetical protein [Methanocalculus natronophilus]|uniref:hypothetical protein n=1 Tax=Methanocalculus natronophilus TaxID=1262400 RepID=UPI0031B64BB8
MPEVPRDGIGRRVFQLKQQRSVEQAIAIIRTTLGEKWMGFSEDDVNALRMILEELWLQTPRSTWKNYSFSRLTYTDIQTITRIGHSRMRDLMSKKEATNQLNQIFQTIASGF